MAYRLPYAPNTALPIATALSAPTRARFYALQASECSPVHHVNPSRLLPPLTDPIVGNTTGETPDVMHMIAVDSVMLDAYVDDMVSISHVLAPICSDHFWLHASLHDPWERSVEIRGRERLPVMNGVEFFGGVATNQVATTEDATWVFMPMKAWGSFEITVEGDVIDTEVLGVAELLHQPRSLRLTLYPWHIRHDGSLFPRPVTAAEDVGLAGLIVEWQDTPYHQVPTVAVRAERGDTLKSIADDMAVDLATVQRANTDEISPDQPLKGDVLRVPLVPRTAPKRNTRATAHSLSWHEMVHGWTTLN